MRSLPCFGWHRYAVVLHGEASAWTEFKNSVQADDVKVRCGP
ncbi:hypothetical protein O1L68_41765 [Streptomyces lydicus]|nr:hypothetical protein [Streptomyces lydicus]